MGVSPSQYRSGFTLIELVVVIAIIGVLVGLLLPAVQAAREMARLTHCMNSARQIALGVTSFESAHGSLPIGMISGYATDYRFRSWLQQILPHMERTDLFEQSNLDYSLSKNPFFQHVGLSTVVPTFQCPSDPSSGRAHLAYGTLVAHTSYLGISGNNRKTRDGVLFLDSKLRSSDVLDGLSNTLLFGERPASNDFWFGWWYAGLGQEGTGSADMLLGVRETLAPGMGLDRLPGCPPGPYQFQRGRNEMCDVMHFWSFHPQGAVFSLCDGSVQLISYSANQILPQLSTRAGHEVFQGLDSQ